jgi:hypothetical protein
MDYTKMQRFLKLQVYRAHILHELKEPDEENHFRNAKGLHTSFEETQTF